MHLGLKRVQGMGIGLASVTRRRWFLGSKYDIPISAQC